MPNSDFYDLSIVIPFYKRDEYVLEILEALHKLNIVINEPFMALKLTFFKYRFNHRENN